MAESKKETIITGDSNTLIQRDWNKWFKNTILFIIPVLILYITSISALLNTSDRTFELKDLIPSQMVWGGIAVYILSTLQDLYLKWSQETKYIQ